jgi:hypothetical protein
MAPETSPRGRAEQNVDTFITGAAGAGGAYAARALIAAGVVVAVGSGGLFVFLIAGGLGAVAGKMIGDLLHETIQSSRCGDDFNQCINKCPTCT